MKDKFKKDKKSLILMGYSLCLILILVIGGVITNNSINTLSKRAYAPANANFSDDALYRCVVDAYNEENDASKSYSADLTDAELQTITKLTCKNQQVSKLIGIQKLTNLKTLDLSNNDLTGVTFYGALPHLEEINFSNNKIVYYTPSANLTPTLKKIDLSNNELTAVSRLSDVTTLTDLNLSYNEITDLDLQSLSELTSLDVRKNKLNKLNLLNNRKLTPSTTKISLNPYETEMYVYNNGSIEQYAINPVTKPYGWDSADSPYQNAWNVSWSLSEHGLITITSDGKIKTYGTGTTKAVGTAPDAYTTTCNINTVELTVSNPKYKIFGDKYLWVGTDATKTEDEIKQSISEKTGKLSDLEIGMYDVADGDDIDILNKNIELYVVDRENSNTIANIPVYGATSTSNLRDMDSDYLYIDESGYSWINKSPGLYIQGTAKDFNLTTSTPFSENNVVKHYNVVKITDSEYDVSVDKDYIWVGTDAIDENITNKINVQNGSVEYNSTNKTLTLKDGAGDAIKTWDIIGWSSDEYDLNGEYVSNTTETDMYVNIKNNSSFNKDNIRVTNGSIEAYRTTITGTSSTVFYYWILKSKNGDVVKKFDTVSFTSSKYDKYLDKDYIDIGAGEINENDFTTDGSSTGVNIKDSKVYITNGPSGPDGSYVGIYKQWDIVSYKSDKYDLSGNYIYVGTDDSIETITSNITSTNIDIVKNDYNQLEFRHGNEVIKTMDIVHCDSSYYDLSKKYIFTGTMSNEFIKSKIDYDEANSSLDIEGDNLVLKPSNSDQPIKTWKLVRCVTDEYVIGKSYAIQKPTYSASDIEVINGSYEGKTSQGNIAISYNGETKEVPIINFKSTNNKYDLEKTFTGNHDSYIYVGTGSLDTGNIRLWFQTHVDMTEQLDDTFEINVANDEVTATIGGEYVYSWKLVKISSEYEINDGFIFVNGEDFDINKMHMTFEIIPIGLKVYNRALYYGNIYAVPYGSDEKWSIINIKSNKYNIGKDTITINDDEFDIDNIDVQVPSSVTYTHSYNDGIYTITVNETSKTYTKTYRVENSKFKDNNLYKCVVDEYNEENSTHVGYGEALSTEQLASLTKLSCDGTGKLDSEKVLNTTGIELLTGIRSLNLEHNHITSIDLSHNTNLSNTLKLGYNHISSLDLSHNPDIQGIEVQSNQLTTLNVSNMSNLKTLDASSNSLASINLPVQDKVKGLQLSANNLESIDVSHYTALESLRITGNKLTSIDVSNNTALQTIDVSNNKLTSLDLSHNTALMTDGVSNREVKIGGNQYHKDMILNLDVPAEIDSPVKLPTHLNWPNPTYTLESPSYATIDGNMITAKKVGTFGLMGSVTDKYSFTIKCTAEGDYYTEVNPEKYDLGNHYLFVEGSFNISDAIATKGAAEAQYDENNSIAKVVVGDQVINQWDVLSIKSDTYTIRDNKIYVGPNQILSEFESKINKKKLDMNISDVNGNSIVDTGDTVTFTNTTHNFSKTYDISSDGIDYGDLEIDGDIIKNVKVGTRLSEIANKIETNATVTTHDKDGNIVDREARTGDQIVITWDSGNSITFRVSVLGDVTCDGNVDMSDYLKLYKHVLKSMEPNEPEFASWEIITEEYRLIAGDVNDNGDKHGDGELNMSDYRRLKRYALALEDSSVPSDWIINYIVLDVLNMGGVEYE